MATKAKTGKVAKKPAAQKEATKATAKPEHIKARTEARTELKNIRNRISGMNAVQLRNFFRKMDSKVQDACVAAISRVKLETKSKALEEARKKVQIMEAELEELSKSK